jgi:catechol 2,3-dioxygenase-like lactoylglutathione lyase family enzyme
MSRFFGNAVHAAFIVPDIRKEIDRLLASGIGPVFTMDRIRPSARYRGKRHDPLMSAAFVYTGGMQYEFVEPHDDTPSAYREFLQRVPAGGFHHLAYFVPSFDGALESARSKGTNFEIVQEFIGPDEKAFEIYVEPLNQPNPLLMQLMIPSPLSAMFDSMEKIAASWDGKDPIRNAFDLLAPGMHAPSE